MRFAWADDKGNTGYVTRRIRRPTEYQNQIAIRDWPNRADAEWRKGDDLVR